MVSKGSPSRPRERARRQLPKSAVRPEPVVVHAPRLELLLPVSQFVAVTEHLDTQLRTFRATPAASECAHDAGEQRRNVMAGMTVVHQRCRLCP